MHQVELALKPDNAADRSALMSTLDRLNDRYGRGTLKVASEGLAGDKRVAVLPLLIPMVAASRFALTLSLPGLRLRIVDKEHSGSPLQDLLQSEFMRDYLEKNETFKEGLIKWFQQKFGFIKKLPELLNSATTRPPAAASLPPPAA